MGRREGWRGKREGDFLQNHFPKPQRMCLFSVREMQTLKSQNPPAKAQDYGTTRAPSPCNNTHLKEQESLRSVIQSESKPALD